MITLHHLNNSRSQRILWLLEELELSYEIKFYERNKKTMLAPKELKEIHPLGKSPVITDGDLTVAESGAIIEYLIQKYGNGRLKPSTEKDLIRYTYFLHYAEGSLMPFLLMSLIFSTVEKKSPLLIRPIAQGIAGNVRKLFISPNIKTHLEFLENELKDRSYFAGEELSGADIQLSFPLEAAKARGLLKNHPRLLAFLQAIQGREAYQKALKAGGSYTILN